MINILFEATPLNKTTLTTTTVRLCAIEANADGCQVNNLAWEPVVTGWPEKTISLAKDGELSSFELGHGSISFEITANRSLAELDWNAAYARCYVGRMGDAFASYKQIFEGLTGPIEIEGGVATVALTGQERKLERPLLNAAYAGTGGAEGTVDLKGKLKPWASGSCLNVEPVLIDAAKLIYQVHGYGPIQAIDAVYESALSLGAPAQSAATYAGLAALTIAAGTWATCPATGMFRLGSMFKGKITADIRGALDGSTYVNQISTIIPHMIKQAGVSAGSIDTASFAVHPQQWCYYSVAQVMVGDIVRDALSHVGGYLFSSGGGIFKAGNFFGSSTPLALNADGSSALHLLSSTMKPATTPAYKVTVGNRPAWTVMSGADISPALTNVSDAAVAAKAAADNAVLAATGAASDAASALNRINSMSNDGILDRADKPNYLREYQRILQTSAKFGTQAATMGVSRAAMDASVSALTAYLTSLSPAYDSMTTDTPIVPATFRQKFIDADAAVAALASAISARAATTATWGQIDGAGKPEDNATYGAPGNSPVGTSTGNAVVTKLNAQAVSIDAMTLDIASQLATVQSIVADVTVNRESIEHIAGDINDVVLKIGTIADGATVQEAVNKLNVADANALARIDDVSRVAASDTNAVAQRATTLEASYNTLDGRITTNATTAASATAVVAQRVSTLEANGGDFSQMSARITSEEGARVSADGALSGRIDTLNARAGNIESSVTSEQQARASADGAMSTRIDTLNARAGTIEASVTTEQQARANADSAVAVRTTALETAKTDLYAKVSSEESTRVGADTALGARIDTVNARSGANEVAITTEQQARATAVSAVANRTTALEVLRNKSLNLFHNASFAEGLAGTYISQGSGLLVGNTLPWGRGVSAYTNSAYSNTYLIFPNIAIDPNQWYVWSADTALFGDGNSLLYIDYLDQNGQFIASAPNAVSRSGSYDFSNDFSLRAQYALPAFKPPSQTRFLRPVLSVSGSTGNWLFGLRNPKLEIGLNPTPYSDDYGTIQAVARANSVETAAIDRDNALSQRSSNLEANYGTLNAKITDNATTAANATSAVSSRTSALEANVGPTNAVISNNATAAANATSALAQRTAALEANVGPTNAVISNNAVAAANATSAVAQRTTTLEASTSSLSASVTTQASAISNLNGRTTAYWQTTAVGGDNVAYVKVVADANSGAGVEIGGDLRLRGNLIVDGTVSRTKIPDGDITQTYQNTFNNNYGSNESEVFATSLYIDLQGERGVLLIGTEGNAYANYTGSGGSRALRKVDAQYTLKYNGSPIRTAIFAKSAIAVADQSGSGGDASDIGSFALIINDLPTGNYELFLRTVVSRTNSYSSGLNAKGGMTLIKLRR